jgi:hypothetical protein
MRSRPGLVLLLAVGLTLAAIAAGASIKTTTLAFTLGVSPDDQAVGLYGNRVACQQPIDVPVAFQTVAFVVAADEPSGPLSVEVRSFPEGRRLGAGRLDDEYEYAVSRSVKVGSIPAGERVSVCFRALGDAGAPGAEEDEGERLQGGPSQAARSSAVFLNGRQRPDDLTLVFLREPRTLLSLVPEMLDRATLWRPGPSSGALLAVLLAIVAISSPILLGRALGRALELDEPPSLDAGAGPTES